MSGVDCPVCGAAVECAWKCRACGKPRPFGTNDGVGAGTQQGGGY